MQNFIKIGQTTANIAQKFDNFTSFALKRLFALFSQFWGKELKEIEIFLNFRVGHHLPTWILIFSNFSTLISLGRRICIAMQNFIKIGQTIAKIL